MKDKDIFFFAIYFLAAAVFAWFYRWQVNTDGLGYLSIAQNYAAGNWQTAVNGFWSPLYSWLVAMFVVCGVPAMAAAKIVGVLAGGLLLVAAKKFLECFDLPEIYKKSALAALAVFAVYGAVSLTTPDGLAAALAILYLGLVFKKNYAFKKYGFWAGILGGLMYLAKTYLFLFFLAHFFLHHLILFWRAKAAAEKKNLIFNFIGGMAAFIIIAGAWVAVLHQKYGEWTLGRTGDYNLAAYGPGAAGDPLDYLGLLPPADQHSLSAWDDPGLIEIPAPRPSSFWEKIKHYGGNFLANSGKLLVVIYSRFSILAPPILLAGMGMIFFAAKKKIFARDYVFLVSAILILQTGYLPIHIEERYVWADFVLLLVLGMLVWRDWKIFGQKPRWKKIGAPVLALTFALAPAYKLVFRIDAGQEYRALYRQVASSGISKNIASNANWSESLILAYYAGGRYFGIPKPENEKEQLEKNGIDYYIFWKDAGALPEFLADDFDLAGDNSQVAIYKLR